MSDEVQLSRLCLDPISARYPRLDERCSNTTLILLLLYAAVCYDKAD